MPAPRGLSTAARCQAPRSAREPGYPWPTPMHIVARPRRPPPAESVRIACATSRAPEHPIGCPSAIARHRVDAVIVRVDRPPSQTATAWEANASFSSIVSNSPPRFQSLAQLCSRRERAETITRGPRRPSPSRGSVLSERGRGSLRSPRRRREHGAPSFSGSSCRRSPSAAAKTAPASPGARATCLAGLSSPNLANRHEPTIIAPSSARVPRVVTLKCEPVLALARDVLFPRDVLSGLPSESVWPSSSIRGFTKRHPSAVSSSVAAPRGTRGSAWPSRTAHGSSTRLPARSNHRPRSRSLALRRRPPPCASAERLTVHPEPPR